MRLSIIGPQLSDHDSLMGWLATNKGRNVRGYANHIWQGLTSLAFARALLTVIEIGRPRKGLFHLPSPQPISKGTLLRKMSDCFSWRVDVDLVDAPNKTDRSMESRRSLITDLNIAPIEEQLVELREFVESRGSCYPLYLPGPDLASPG